MTIAHGACGHPLHPDDGCRLCALAETDEERNARLTRTKPPPPQTFRVTSVTRYSSSFADDDGETETLPMMDASGFVEGESVDFFDGSGLRYDERERWRGREIEANAWDPCDGDCDGLCPNVVSAMTNEQRAILEAASRRRHLLV